MFVVEMLTQENIVSYLYMFFTGFRLTSSMPK
jgi:hypothetical protein